MTTVLLIPNLPLKRWPSMDRYASRLACYLKRYATDLEITVANRIGNLTMDQRRSHAGIYSWQPIPHPLLPAPRPDLGVASS